MKPWATTGCQEHLAETRRLLGMLVSRFFPLLGFALSAALSPPRKQPLNLTSQTVAPSTPGGTDSPNPGPMRKTQEVDPN